MFKLLYYFEYNKRRPSICQASLYPPFNVVFFLDQLFFLEPSP